MGVSDVVVVVVVVDPEFGAEPWPAPTLSEDEWEGGVDEEETGWKPGCAFASTPKAAPGTE